MLQEPEGLKMVDMVELDLFGNQKILHVISNIVSTLGPLVPYHAWAWYNCLVCQHPKKLLLLHFNHRQYYMY